MLFRPAPAGYTTGRLWDLRVSASRAASPVNAGVKVPRTPVEKWSEGRRGVLVLIGLVWRGEESGFLAFFEAVAVSPDAQGRGVVEESVEDGGGDDGVAEDVSPVAVALVARQEDASFLVARADELEEDGRALVVEWQVAHLVDDEDFGGEIDAESSVESLLAGGVAEVLDEVVGGDEVGAEAGVNGLDGEGDGKVRLADAGRSEEYHVLGLVDEAEGTELGDLAGIDGGLEVEVELVESLAGGESGHVEAGLEIAGSAGLDFGVDEVEEEVGVGALLFGGALEMALDEGVGFSEFEAFEMLVDALEGEHQEPPPVAMRS